MLNVRELSVNGEKVCEREFMAVAVKEFSEDIGGMNEPEASNNIIFLVNERDLSEEDVEVSRGKVEHVLKNIMNEKATGNGEISYEMYNWDGESMIDVLMNLFKAVWNAGRVSERWNESRVILLHKEGHKRMKELKNYRPITLMDTISKIFCMLMKERMKNSIEQMRLLSDDQNGFRANRRGEENMYIQDPP